VRAALAQARLELLDLGREVLGDRHRGSGLGGEVEDDVVEDLEVAQLPERESARKSVKRSWLNEVGCRSARPPSRPAAGR
jgi:hypothetical protein